MDHLMPMRSEKGLDSASGPMEPLTKANGKETCATVRDCSFHSMAQYMKGNGLEILDKELAS